MSNFCKRKKNCFGNFETSCDVSRYWMVHFFHFNRLTFIKILKLIGDRTKLLPYTNSYVEVLTQNRSFNHIFGLKLLSWHIEVMAERSGLQSLAPNSPRKRPATSQVFGFRADWRRTYCICAISKDSIKENKHFPGIVYGNVFMEIAHLSLPWSNAMAE